MTPAIDLTRLAELLDRLDPAPTACRVCGCVHDSVEHGATPLAVAA